jgi:hypothetical protein
VNRRPPGAIGDKIIPGLGCDIATLGSPVALLGSLIAN